MRASPPAWRGLVSAAVGVEPVEQALAAEAPLVADAPSWDVAELGAALDGLARDLKQLRLLWREHVR